MNRKSTSRWICASVFCWNTMLYVGSTSKTALHFSTSLPPQKTHAKTHPVWFLWILIGWKPSTFTPGSLWCNIFTLLYTLKSNYGAPPLPQACWWDRCLGNELEIGLLSCCFFLGGDMGQSLQLFGFVTMKRLYPKMSLHQPGDLWLKKGWVELCCCAYVMVPFVHSTILFEDRYLHKWVECFIKCMQFQVWDNRIANPLVNSKSYWFLTTFLEGKIHNI